MKGVFRRRFTSEEDAVIRQRAAAGVGDAAIAKELGRSKKGVFRRRHLLGASKPEAWPPERIACFKQLWTDGVLRKDIARAMGIHVSKVGKWRKRLGLPPREGGRAPGFRSPDFKKVVARLEKFDEPQTVMTICAGLRLRRRGAVVVANLVYRGIAVVSGPRGNRRYILASKATVEK